MKRYSLKQNSIYSGKSRKSSALKSVSNYTPSIPAVRLASPEEFDDEV